MKIVFVASDFSGLGKGTFAASLGRVFRSFGVDARVMKSDLYFNYDAGTINPGEHGEVYVLKDGTEVDQDFGIYERFLNIDHTSKDYITSGRLFHKVYLNERNGKYLGQTVSVEHITKEIKDSLLEFANQCQVGIIELGATIGDIKGVYLLEAVRQMINEYGSDNAFFVLLSYIPYLPNVGELKTMGCQRSVNALRSKGIKTDVIIARTSEHDTVPDYQMGKLQLYCEVPKNAVYSFPDLDDYYQIPKRIRSTLLHNYIALKMNILLGEDNLDKWYSEMFSEPLDLKIALVGKYPHQDAYISIINQLRLLGVYDVSYMESPKNLHEFDAIIIPGGWGERGVEEMIKAAQICREENIPCLGICLGLQIMVIEYSRNVLKLEDANSLEFNEDTKNPVVTLQEEQKKRQGLGGSSRLGDWITKLSTNSKVFDIYKNEEITQRHRHRYEISSDYDFKDFKIVGRDKKTGLVEVMELLNHPFYIGVQFHPEFTSTKNPIFKGLIDSVKNMKKDNIYISEASSLKGIFRRGTPNSYLDNIDISNKNLLIKIIELTNDKLEKYGISKEQRILVNEIVDLLKDKKEKLDNIQKSIDGLQLKMREINLMPSHIDGEPLEDDEIKRLSDYETEIKRLNNQLASQRQFYQSKLLNIDSKVKEINSVN